MDSKYVRNMYSSLPNKVEKECTLLASLAGSHNSTGLTDQALCSHWSARNSITVWHVLSVTAFCIRMYRPGRRCSSFELTCSVFGPVPLWLALVALYRPFAVTLFILDLISSLYNNNTVNMGNNITLHAAQIVNTEQLQHCIP